MDEALVVGLHHVQVSVPGRQRGRATGLLRRGLLGMTELAKPPVLAARGGVWFRSGDCEIHCGVEKGFTPARKAHPGIAVSDVDELARRCGAAGLPVRWDQNIEGVRRFHTDDPVGNRIELQQVWSCSRPASSLRRAADSVVRIGSTGVNRFCGSSSGPGLGTRSLGSASSPARPFQARLTRCAATSGFFGLRESSHHWPVSATMPTSIWAYIGAVFGSRPALLELGGEQVLDLGGDVADQAGERPVACATGESRTRIRNPSGRSSM